MYQALYQAFFRLRALGPASIACSKAAFYKMIADSSTLINEKVTAERRVPRGITVPLPRAPLLHARESPEAPPPFGLPPQMPPGFAYMPPLDLNENPLRRSRDDGLESNQAKRFRGNEVYSTATQG